MKTRILFVLAILIMVGLPLSAQNPALVSKIEVSETGVVSAPANMVRISFSVESSAANAGEAVRMNARQTDALLKALKSSAGAEDRLETSGYSLNPVYGRNTPATPTAYRVRNTVVLTSKSIEKAGSFIDLAAEAGANRVDSLSFSHDQGERLRAEASVKALKKALQTAERLAEAAGMRLKRIVTINYHSPGPTVRFARTTLQEAGGTPTPIEAGELSVSASVHVTVEIE
jgi:uncharacterized protein YggE